MPLTPMTRQDAAAALKRGGIVIFPTETFYGLGCDAMNPDAAGALYAAKRRPYRLPLPVIIGKLEQLDSIVAEIHPLARKLMDRFWPGPLTLIMPARPDVPDLLTSGTRRIAVRFSSHPAATALCRESGLVLTSSSANISGVAPVCRVDDLDPALAGSVAGIYDEAPAPAGGEASTIVDIVPGIGPGAGGEGIVRILRQGVVSLEQLLAEVTNVIVNDDDQA